jgi:hypothetical protein
MIIDFFRIDTSNLLDGLAEYLEILETQLPDIHTKERKSIEAWAESESVDPAEFDAAFDEYQWTYNYFFPRSLCYSFVVLLFLVLENQLGLLCDEIMKRRDLNLQATDFSGSALKRAKTYLEKVVGITGIDWEKVEDLSKVRNCFVHTLGKVELSTDKERLHHLAKESFGISISGSDYSDAGVILITTEYCANSLVNVRKFFDAIFDAAGFGERLSMY